MNALQPLNRAGIDVFDVEWFAEAYLRSPLAQTMFERGEPLKFFLPVQLIDCEEWGGVNITIAGVTRSQIARDHESDLVVPERGNGYSGNHAGPLVPGDFGVHSHPDTTKLLKKPGDAGA